MSTEFKFFIYLLERYAEYKGMSTPDLYSELAQKNLIDYAIDMYELYHVESLQNAFADLDAKLNAA